MPLTAAVFTLALLAPGSAADAQQQESRVVPRDDYFIAMRAYYAGEYRTSLRNFRTVAAGGVRSTQGRWVDSICYHTMMGECYYHMGELALALEQYEAALALLVQHGDWLLRVQFPPAIAPSASTVRSRITWGATARGTHLGNYPDTMTSFQGRLNNDQAIIGGGVVTPPSFHPLRVTEIIRCCGLALYRRWELMGPAGQHSPISQTIVESLSSRSAPANHWSQTWIEAQLGLAKAAAGNRAEAVTHLQRAVVAGGEYDHHLTPLVLLALGNLALADNNLEAAGNFYLEASFSAAAMGQPDVVQEAFRHGLTVHLARGGQGAYPPLVLAQPWARREGFDACGAWLQVLAAESFTSIGDGARAREMLLETRRRLARSEMRAGELGARFEYQNALWSFQQGDAAAGTASLAAALAYGQRGSRRLLHVVLADNAFVGGTVSDRVAKDLYAGVLRDPTPSDWAIDPLESMAMLTTPLVGPMERWFGVALSRKENELALEISERIRRRRFFAAMPLGGRLLALRWIMEAPQVSLTEEAVLRRQDLRARYPRYVELQRQSAALRDELAALNISPKDNAELQQQKKLYADWARVSAQQEAILSEIALRREPADLVFPPIRKLADMQERMPQGQLVLSFFNTSRGVAVFLFSKENYAVWFLEEPAKVAAAAKAMLKEMGHHEANQAVSAADLRGDAWKKPAGELMKLLLKNARPEFWDDFDELAVVPDGLLWYVPFEALTVRGEDGGVPLLSKVRVRYAPTVGLVLPDERGRNPDANTVVITGRLFPRDDDALAKEALGEIQRVLPKTSGLSDLAAPSGIQKSLWDRLVVLDDMVDRSLVGLDWSPAQIDRGKPGSTLADWFPLPWGAPEAVVLPGFHTAAENGLRRGAAGDEIFLSLCALMSTGTRTVLLSRWRTGGQTSFDLVREFVQELPATSASQAWRRSVLLARSTHLDPDREPRAKLSLSEEPLTAEHPFFWSGYILCDSGSEPKRDDPRP